MPIDRALASAASSLRPANPGTAGTLARLADLAALDRRAQREEFADALHDRIAPMLFAADLVLARRAERESGHDEEVRRAHELIVRTEAALRELMAEVAPVESVGIDGRLAAAAADIEELHGLPVRLAVSPDGMAAVRRLGAPVAELLERVAREALLNAAKHSGARRLETQLETRDQRLLLSVMDDGRGPGGAPDGHGLAAIRRAVRRQGGTLRIEPRAPRGAAVRVSFPLSPAGGPAP